MSEENTSTLFLITGYRGAGKTTFCRRMAQSARDAGWDVAGILSNPLFEGDLRIAIQAEDVRTGETHILALRSEDPTPGAKHWKFDRETLDWGNQVFHKSYPCDLLVVDELGPLEFESGSGWQAGLEAINSRQYAIALVIIREELLGEALLRWSDARLVEIDTLEDSEYKSQVLAEQLF
jgi:nucleoside-triphosphatase